MTRIPSVISVFKCGVAAARTQLAALDAERLRLRQLQLTGAQQHMSCLQPSLLHGYCDTYQHSMFKCAEAAHRRACLATLVAHKKDLLWPLVDS